MPGAQALVGWMKVALLHPPPGKLPGPCSAHRRHLPFPGRRRGSHQSHRCECEHCMQRALETWPLIGKGGESSHQRVLGRSRDPPACRLTALSPVRTPSPWSGSPGAHSPAPCRVAREKQSRGEAGGPWGVRPDCGSLRRVSMVTSEVAYLLTNKAAMTPRRPPPPQPRVFHRRPGHRGPQCISPRAS